MKRTLVVALLALGASTAVAQGNLSTQGLGFPPGQLSTKAMGMGGAIGDGDPMSPLNPASLSMVGFTMLSFQAEPEFREVKIGGKAQKTSVARFPLFMAFMPFSPRIVGALSASTLFDRTWSTFARDSQVLGTDTIRSTVSQLSEGSVVDLRAGFSYQLRPWLRLGIGGHAYSGQTSLRIGREFDDTARFQADTQRTKLSYGGNAVSLGVQTVWPKIAAIGVNYRRGGTLRTYDGDTITGTGSVPDHFGVSAVYLGIEGTTLAVRMANDKWSRAKGISSSLKVHEGWDFGLGAETLGPRVGSSPLTLRAGARWRTLPFSTDANAISEKTLSGGFGFPMSRGRSEVNFGILRSSRSGYTGASESAWTLSTGIAIRP